MQIKLITGCDIPKAEITVRCREADDKIAALMAMLRIHGRKLTGIKDGALHILDPRDVLYADTVDNKVFLYAEKDVYETPLKLYEIEERLRAHSFVRVSKSQVVNFNRVESVRPEFNGRLIITVQNGEKLLASRQYAIAIKKNAGGIIKMTKSGFWAAVDYIGRSTCLIFTPLIAINAGINVLQGAEYMRFSSILTLFALALGMSTLSFVVFSDIIFKRTPAAVRYGICYAALAAVGFVLGWFNTVISAVIAVGIAAAMQLILYLSNSARNKLYDAKLKEYKQRHGDDIE